jgi:hypothetical protein
MCERRLRRKEMANAVSMLREEIASLEQEINKRNRALAVLTESPAPVKSTPAPVKSTPAPVKSTPAPVKSTPAPVKSAPAAAPVVVTLGERILAHLGANKGKLIAPVEIAKALAATDSNIKSESVQRRLGELFKRKRVKRDNGRYGV